MWNSIAHIILKNRIVLLVILLGITGFMGYKGSQAEMTYEFAELVPQTHQEMIYFKRFKKLFGDDAAVLAIGVKDSSLYDYKNFRRYAALCDEIEALDGVDTAAGVIAMPTVPYLKGEGKKRKRKFTLTPIFEDGYFESETEPADFKEKLALIESLGFFKGTLYNSENGSTLILIPIIKRVLDSEERLAFVDRIEVMADNYSADTGMKLYFGGLSYVRSTMAGQVRDELRFFLGLSLVVTALILFLFFRSFYAVIFPVCVIGMAVLWTIGSVVLFGFKISMLSGLIPPIIVVIGIPNCIYLLNKYHQEFAKHGNKIRALQTIIRKIGIVTLITNCTTAVGFLVLISADITMLKEFGIVAGLNVFATFFISVIMIPVVFSFLPDPGTKQLKHLSFKSVNFFLDWLNRIVLNHRKAIYIVTTFIIVVGGWGSWKIYSLSYMIDDLPEKSKVKQDLRFFESNFNGVMPLEIVIHFKDEDGKRDKKGFENLDNLRAVAALEDFLRQQPELSEPMSVVSFVKAAKQSLYYDHPEHYELPPDTRSEQAKFARFLKESQKSNTADIFDSDFLDSTGAVRISVKMADIGSKRMDTLIRLNIEPAADSIFLAHGIAPDFHVTGTTLLFIKGNAFLIKNLRQSLFIAIILISIIMGSLFKNVRMIILSLIPNLIPLIITGALMGYLGIPLKPSTALIFSIAFGISVDDSIHFLAKYRQELFANNFNVIQSVSHAIKETGASMIYTSIVLFCGFIIFAWSDFLGTVMLGVLTSTTLLMAMITNLVVLPALLITFDSGKRKRGQNLLIDTYSKSELEDDDEDEIAISVISNGNGHSHSENLEKGKPKEESEV